MKTIITIFTLFLGINLMIAQPVVNSDILLNIGDERMVTYVESEFDPGEAGENKTWDFSNIVPIHDIIWEALDPGDTGLEDLFPTADLAFIVPGDNTQESYTDGWTYYDVGDGEEISLLGSILFNIQESIVDTNFFYLNDDPDLLFEFPMTYLDQFSDDVAGTNIVHFQNQVFEVERTGTTTTFVDGYGTLITPEGTFNNVIRVKRTEDLTDTYLNIPTYHEIVRYDWFSPEYDYLLYHTEDIIIRDAGGNEQSHTGLTYYAEPVLITGITNQKVESFTTYPNPCSSFLNLPVGIVEHSSKVEILNTQGISVYYDQQQISKIDVSSFQPGIYIVHVVGENGKLYQSRFVVI